MVGLKVVLEGINDIDRNNYYSSTQTSATYHQVVSKASMMMNKISPTSPTPPSFSRRSCTLFNNSNFLDNCFLCRNKLLPSHDIYMYKGDRAFCSEECRCKQMYMDEEDSDSMKKPKTKRGDNCSLAASKPQRHHVVAAASSSSSSQSSPSSSRSSRNKGSTKRSNGFIY